MSKFILILLVILSVVLYGTYEITALRSTLGFLEGIYVALDGFFETFRTMFSSLFGALPPFLQNIIIFAVFLIAFIIVWSIIFAIIGAIARGIRKKKIKNALGEEGIVLTEEQQAQFDYKLYEKKFRFPTIRFIFILLELLLVAVFVIIRFDVIYAVEGGVLNEGDLLLFTYEGKPFVVDTVLTFESLPRLTLFHGFINSVRVQFVYFIATLMGYYIQLMNSLLGGFGPTGALVAEIIIIVLVALVLILFTFLLGLPFAGLIRRARAKKYAKKAKQKYIKKLEDEEYKAWKKANKKGGVSEKNQNLYNEDTTGPTVDVEPIVVQNKDETVEKTTAQTPEQNYIDDISTGVTDLGLVEEDDNELQKPLTTRETRFVGDEESDIVLEEEPIIETIEEEEEYYNANGDEVDENFEKYQPETAKDIELEDKVKKYNIDVIDENEDVQPFKEETPAIEEFDDREIAYVSNEIVEPTPVEPVQEEKPVEEVKKTPTKRKPATKKTTKTKKSPTKTKKTTKSTTKKPTKPVKPIKPVDAVDEKGKGKDYILETSDGSQLAMSEEEISSMSVKPEKKPTKKSSALTRNATVRSKTKKPVEKKPSTKKEKTTSKKPSTKKTTPKKEATPKEKPIKKPTKPVSAKK